MMFLCVGFAISPFFSNNLEKRFAMSLYSNYSPMKSPLPLKSLILSLTSVFLIALIR